ncbi:cation:proton antiporter [Demequina aurantiaca]|uniref:cation:proton antiporter n=1 Tax=Demequina aurantiaca TaxID=676200 RepID=UPI000783D352|nr:sodium:proton antiporter [Demequina aurantiaca]
MEYAVIAVLAVVGIVAVNSIAPRVGVAAPLVLVAAGVAVSFIPGVPHIDINPEVILAGVLPPLLYSAAVSVPTMEFRRNFSAISGMSVLLVIVGSVLMGFFFWWVIPDISLPIAIALGAIVSPTDAVATNIIKRLGVSPRVVTVLEGESMLNDASALVLLRSAIAAAAVSVTVIQVAFDFAKSVIFAVAIGALVGYIGLRVRKKISNAAASTAISFVLPFVAFVPAEALDASGLVAAVTAGLVTSALSAKYLSPQDRISQTTNWRTVELLLEGAIFSLMGLELIGIVESVEERHGSVWFAVGLGGIALVLVLAIRSLYVFMVLVLERRRARKADASRSELEDFASLAGEIDDDRKKRHFAKRVEKRVADVDYLTDSRLGRREGVVLVWAGMRGALTLAASQTLPADTPARSTLVLIAFVVAAGSLLIQGGTLPWLVRKLGLVSDTTAADDAEESGLLDELSDTASKVLEDPELRRPDGTPYDERAVRWLRVALVRERGEEDRESRPVYGAQINELRLKVIAEQREYLMEARAVGAHSTDALRHALRVLDSDQISAELRNDHD